MNSIVHFTTVHPRSDTRVRLKEVETLARAFRVPVALYVQDGLGSSDDTAGTVVDTGAKARLLLVRMTAGAWRMFRAVRRARPLVAHFHDPELIPVGLLLKLSGTTVVYDVHEDLPRQIAGKRWIPPHFRPPLALTATALEWLAGRAFDAIVPATPSIAERFPREKCALVQNFPLPGELVEVKPSAYANRPPHIAYVGGISAPRGVMEMIGALPLTLRKDVRLRLVGAFAPSTLELTARSVPGWEYVDFLGWADRQTVKQVLGRVRAGLVLFHPAPNHVNSQPNKLFEYMAAGLPVIASDFPLWRQVIQETECGLLVNPQDPAAIAGAIRWILDNPREAEAMGRRGQKAVEERYNWEAEGAKLVGLYERLLRQPSESGKA